LGGRSAVYSRVGLLSSGEWSLCVGNRKQILFAPTKAKLRMVLDTHIAPKRHVFLKGGAKRPTIDFFEVFSRQGELDIQTKEERK
jgi:hypothetical protein